ncbi:MAG: right-handed parallel beta-helix repeat-containing protein [Porphyromonas sp.]|nr:right-handed parallel beta-helix repeat-containing protein [Porphyromonas sp.]
MKQLIVTTLVVISMIFSSCVEQGRGRSLTLKPSGGDDTATLLELLDEAKQLNEAGDHVTLDLGKGTYHISANQLPSYELYISNHDHVAERPVAFMLKGFKGLTLKGDGAQLLFHGRLIPIVVQESEGVLLEGFSIDYPRPALSQVEVLSIDAERDEVTVRVPEETEFRIDNDKNFILLGEGFEQALFVTMPFSESRHMKWGRADVAFDPARIVDHGDHTLTLVGWRELPHLEVGDRYVLRSYYRPTPGITIIDSEEVKLQEVAVRYAEGMALIAQNSRDLTLDQFQVAVAEGSERYFTTQADATHFSGCRGKLLSTNGVYEHMADDAINVHGTYMRVDSLLSERELLVSFAHYQSYGFRWFDAGDTLRLINRSTLLPVTGALPDAKVEVLSPSQMKIALAEPLEDGLAGLSLAVENLSTHPAVVFSDNLIRNNRARGALFSTPKQVLCEKNTFDHTHGSAILLCGDANGWYESGPCEEIIIRENHFINALTAMYQFTNGVISIDPEIPELVEGSYYHGRVVVEDNIFDQFPTPLYYAESVTELIFKGNEIRPNNDFKSIFRASDARAINVGVVEEDHFEGW